MLHWLPEDVSPYGAGIDGLFRLIYYITATAFLVVTVLMVVFLVLYRHREGRRTRLSGSQGRRPRGGGTDRRQGA